MIEISGEVTFDGPAGEVWDFLADPRNEEAWNPDVKWVKQVGDGPIGVGSVFEGEWKGSGRMEMRITGFDRDRRLAFTGGNKRMTMTFAFDFADGSTDTSTTLATTGSIEPHGFAKVMMGLMAPMIRKQFAGRPEQMRGGFERWRAKPSAAPAEPVTTT
jgi:uncharacterized protein YndB with AHSA1/START domain